MEPKPVKIELKHYHYKCGDGCCDYYGLNVYVDGKQLDLQNEDLKTQLEQILKHLGYQPTVEETWPPAA